MGVMCAQDNHVLGTVCSDKNRYSEWVTRNEFIERFGCKPESPMGQQARYSTEWISGDEYSYISLEDDMFFGLVSKGSKRRLRSK